MRSLRSLVGLVAAIGCAMLILCGPVLAQRSGGGGGGGGKRTGGRYNVLWDNINSSYGAKQKWNGAVNVSTYITTLYVSMKVQNIDLPDNTVLTVTVYAKDWWSGLPWEPKVGGTFSVLLGAGALTTSQVWVTASGGIPLVTKIEVSAPDGTVIATGHI